MVKYAICGDIHWSTYSSIIRKRNRKYSQRLTQLIKCVNWFEKLSKDNNCVGEIFLGDTLDRPDLNAEELTALQDIKWNKTQKYFLVGNHESNINTLEYSSAKYFESINANVIDKCQKLEVLDNLDLYLIPYITTDKVLSIKDYITDDDHHKIIFAHQDLAGLQYGKFISRIGFDVDDIINNCDLFFNGHLHNHQIIKDKIHLVGILCGQNFNEDASKFDHFAYILTINDDGTTSIEKFINPEAFNFYKLRFETEKDFEQLNDLKCHAVVSIVCEEKLSSKAMKLVKSNKNISESRLILFYDYSRGSDGTQSILVDDYIKQFIILAQEKIEPSLVLDSELARLGGI